MKNRVLSTRYSPRNRIEENNLGWQELDDVDENKQRLVNQEIEKGIRNLVWQNRIILSIAIGQFLNLQDKSINNDTEIIVDKIANAYIIGNRTHKTDKKDMIMPKVSYLDVIQALQKVRLYEKQCENGESE